MSSGTDVDTLTMALTMGVKLGGGGGAFQIENVQINIHQSHMSSSL